MFNFTPFPILESHRVLLRQPVTSDDVAYFRIRSNTEVNKYIGRKDYQHLEEAQQFIIRINNNIFENESILWTMALKDTQEIIGTICLWNLSIEENHAEIGYEMHPDYHGKGYIQEAIHVVLEYGFTKMKVQTIYGVPAIEHIKSIRLLEKFGFTRDYEAEKTMLYQDEIGKQVYYALKNNMH